MWMKMQQEFKLSTRFEIDSLFIEQNKYSTFCRMCNSPV